MAARLFGPENSVILHTLRMYGCLNKNKTLSMPTQASLFLAGTRLQQAFLIRLLAFLLAYCALAAVVIALSIPGRIGIPIWPAAGVAVAAILLLGNGAWLVPFAGATFAALLRDTTVGYALMSGLGASIDALFCVWMLRHWFKFDIRLYRVTDIWGLVGASVISSALCSNFSLADYAIGGKLAWSHYFAAWAGWLSGDALGILMLTPLILAWSKRAEHADFTPATSLRVLLYGLVIISNLIAFFDLLDMSVQVGEALMLLVYPSLAWAVLRFCLCDVATTLFLTCVLAIAGFYMHFGPFVLDSGHNLRQLTFFLWMTLLPGLSIYVATAANRRMLSSWQENYEQLTTLVETVPDAIFLKDGEGRWQVTNQIARGLFLLDGKEWRGKTDMELASETPERHSVYEACVESDEMAFRNGNLYMLEESLIGSDGSQKDIEVRKFPRIAPDGSRAGLVIIGRDITQQKASQKALIASEARYKEQARLLQTVLDALPAQVGLLDERGRIITVNRGWNQFCEGQCNLLSVTGVGDAALQICSQMIGLSTSQGKKIENGIMRVLHGEVPQFVCEYSLTYPKRKRWFNLVVLPIDSDAGKSGVVVMSVDITQSKSSEEVIRLREQQYRAITENSPDMIIRMDGTGSILFANHALLRHFGSQSHSTIGLNIGSLWGDDAAELWRDAVRKIALKQHEQMDIIFDWETPAEKKALHAHLVSENTKGSNDITSILAMIRDVTLLKEKTNRLRLLAAENEAVREKEKKHIARELHDELGQLLNALRMDIGLLNMQHGSQVPEMMPRTNKMLDTLDRAMTSMRGVVTHLRPNVLDMGLVPTLEWLRDDFTKMFEIPCVLSCRGDASGISDTHLTVIFRIIQESLTNIAKHANADLVNIDLLVEKDCLRLVVQDNGNGFDLEAVRGNPQCFGLLGMQERMLALGGKLEIVTTLGAGCSVVLNIPMIVEGRGLNHD